MPTKVVTFRRWEIAVAFVVLTIAFTVMGVILSNQNDTLKKQNKILLHHTNTLNQQVKRQSNSIKLIQTSRIEACEQNYKDIQGVINLFIEEEKAEKGGKLSKGITLLVLRYYRSHPKDCRFLSTSK